MRMRGLIVAVLVLAALGVGLWWSQKTEELKTKSPETSKDAPKILNVPEDQIQKVEIRRADEAPLTLEKKSGQWQIVAPQPLPTDQSAVQSLVTALAFLSSDRLVDEKAADLSEFGLAKPALEVAVTTKAGKTHQLEVGDEAPTGGSYFAMLRGAPRLYTVSSYVKNAVDKTPNDLRDKRLLRFSSDTLARVELTARAQTVEFGKNSQSEWQIIKPKPLRADGGQVEALVDKLRNAKMEPAGTDEEAKKAAAAFAAGTPVAVAKVSDASGEQQLQVRKDRDGNYYARSSVVEGVHKIGADTGAGLDKSLEDFRNKKLFDFGWNDPSKIEVRDGAKQTVFSRTGESWTSGGKPLEPLGVQALVDKLRDLAAVRFVDKGFTTPALEFTVTSGEGKRVERVALSKAGADWIGRRENDPVFYQLDAKVVEELQTVLGGVKPTSPQPTKK